MAIVVLMIVVVVTMSFMVVSIAGLRGVVISQLQSWSCPWCLHLSGLRKIPRLWVPPVATHYKTSKPAPRAQIPTDPRAQHMILELLSQSIMHIPIKCRRSRRSVARKLTSRHKLFGSMPIGSQVHHHFIEG